MNSALADVEQLVTKTLTWKVKWIMGASWLFLCCWAALYQKTKYSQNLEEGSDSYRVFVYVARKNPRAENFHKNLQRYTDDRVEEFRIKTNKENHHRRRRRFVAVATSAAASRCQWSVPFIVFCLLLDPIWLQTTLNLKYILPGRIMRREWQIWKQFSLKGLSRLFFHLS